MKDPAIILFTAVVVVLIVATLVGEILARRNGKADPSHVIDNLNARIRSWWIMVGLVTAAFLAGKPGIIALFALASFTALREFLSLLHTRRADHIALWATFFAVLPIQYYLVAIEWYAMYSIFIPVYAFLALPIIAAFRGDAEGFMTRVSEVQWAVMTCVFCISHVPALMTLEIAGYEGQSILLIAFFLIVVQGSDVLQYVWGKLVGRRKIAPRLSPSKTVEGFLGGVASATLLGGALWWLTPFTVPQAMAMALVIAVMGFLGGLVMSAVKRDLGVKDWSDMIAGHGGVLDRMDSVIFSAPVFFHFTRYWFTV
ncbi:MAG: phosphatidate cytidylyltransferase [Pseudomonadota bacterium]|jgi:phosphatidate cytidylyltransferase